MRPIVLLGLLLVAAPAVAQDTLRLPTLQEAAVHQDPRLRQLALEETITELRLGNIAVERLPELSLTGEAVRQSDVAGIPIDLPNVDIPVPPKDRYEVAVEANWLLYDGGVLGARSDVERADLEVARAELAAELHPLRSEVSDAFFEALVLQERLREIAQLVEDLEARLSETRARVHAGSALPGDTAAMRAEMLRAIQQRDEAAADRRASLEVLAKLAGRPVSEADVLELPDLDAQVAAVLALPDSADQAVPRVHPQYAVFEARRERLEEEAALVRARATPQVSAFGQLAYGRPGLQQFTRDLHEYWLGGLRFRWMPWDWRSTDREVESLRIEERIVDTEEAALTERLIRLVQRPIQAMRRLAAAVETDAEIITLQEQVERQARAQFAERVITASAYVDARTDLQEARIVLVRHRAELARAQAEYLTRLGVRLR